MTLLPMCAWESTALPHISPNFHPCFSVAKALDKSEKGCAAPRKKDHTRLNQPQDNLHSQGMDSTEFKQI